VVGGAEGTSEGDSLGLHVGNADDVGDALGHTNGVGREAEERVVVRMLTCVNTRTGTSDLHEVGLVEGVSEGGVDGNALGSPVGSSVDGA